MEFPNIEDTNYFTNRKLKNNEGEATGKIIMWRLKGREEFHYVLKCPYCRHEQEGEVTFKRRPYRIKCKNCNKSIMVEKIKPKKK